LLSFSGPSPESVVRNRGVRRRCLPAAVRSPPSSRQGWSDLRMHVGHGRSSEACWRCLSAGKPRLWGLRERARWTRVQSEAAPVALHPWMRRLSLRLPRCCCGSGGSTLLSAWRWVSKQRPPSRLWRGPLLQGAAALAGAVAGPGPSVVVVDDASRGRFITQNQRTSRLRASVSQRLASLLSIPAPQATALIGASGSCRRALLR